MVSTTSYAAQTPEQRLLAEFEQAGLRVAERNFDPGNLVFAPGTSGERLYFLLSGALRLYRTYGSSKEATTGMLKGQGVFGQFDLSDGQPEGRQDNEFAVAVTEARVATVRKGAVKWLIRRQPEFAPLLFAVLHERFVQSEKVAQGLRYRQVGSRLAFVLTNLGERFGSENGEKEVQSAGDRGIVIDLRLTHQDLACMVASTREAVSKKIGEFQRKGLLEVTGGKKISIQDPGALLEYAGAR